MPVLRGRRDQVSSVFELGRKVWPTPREIEFTRGPRAESPVQFRSGLQLSRGEQAIPPLSQHNTRAVDPGCIGPGLWSADEGSHITLRPKKIPNAPLQAHPGQPTTAGWKGENLGASGVQKGLAHRPAPRITRLFNSWKSRRPRRDRHRWCCWHRSRPRCIGPA